MAERPTPLQSLTDAGLEAALRDLGGALAFPDPARTMPDLATSVRQGIEAAPPSPVARWPWQAFRPRSRSFRRSLVLALAALLVLAAIAGAVGFGLPGIRILFGGATPSPTAAATASPSSGLGPLGASLGLGTALPLAEIEALAGFDLLLPSDPAIGPPDASYLDRGRVALVWGERPGLPAAGSDGIGLLVSQFRGSVDEGYYQKILQEDAGITPVLVDGGRGYWISGAPHFFVYVGPDGEEVEDSHRWVGDTLIWTIGEMTYRLESGLAMEDALRLAATLE